MTGPKILDKIPPSVEVGSVDDESDVGVEGGSVVPSVVDVGSEVDSEVGGEVGSLVDDSVDDSVVSGGAKTLERPPMIEDRMPPSSDVVVVVEGGAVVLVAASPDVDSVVLVMPEEVSVGDEPPEVGSVVPLDSVDPLEVG